MLIAALSDTHIPSRARSLPEALVERLGSVDLILHAGDITTLATLNLLKSLAPTEAVHGNVDEDLLRTTLPKTRTIVVEGYRLGLVHGDSASRPPLHQALQTFRDVDCIVFGHSHSPYLQRHGPVLMLNPGSPTDKRREPRPSFALIHISESLSAEIVYL